MQPVGPVWKKKKIDDNSLNIEHWTFCIFYVIIENVFSLCHNAVG